MTSSSDLIWVDSHRRGRNQKYIHVSEAEMFLKEKDNRQHTFEEQIISTKKIKIRSEIEFITSHLVP